MKCSVMTQRELNLTRSDPLQDLVEVLEDRIPLVVGLVREVREASGRLEAVRAECGGNIRAM